MQITNKFYVEKLSLEKLQEIRIKHRQGAVGTDNDALENDQNKKLKYTPKQLSNGDTLEQHLARSRHLL